jgi:ADP-ribose pyrophosphatase YjhB (NUDIX family)
MDYHIKVRASALIIENDCILLVEFDDETGLHYNLPGGTIEPGESIIKGLKREVKEETTANIEVGDLVFALEYEPQRNLYWAGPVHSLSLMFDCKLSENLIPQLPETSDVNQTAVKWINLSDLEKIELLPHMPKRIMEYARKRTIDKIFWEEPLMPDKAQVYLK